MRNATLILKIRKGVTTIGEVVEYDAEHMSDQLCGIHHSPSLIRTT